MTPTDTIDALNAEAWKKRMSDPAGAVELAAEAERLSRREPEYPRGIGWSLLTVGICALNRSEHERAGEHLAAALDLLAGGGEGEAHALNGIGRLHWVCGEYRPARERYRESLDIARDTGNRGVEATALHGIGTVLSSLGEYPEALEHYRASLGIARQIGDRAAEAGALGYIGNVHTFLGENSQALECYQASLRISREVGDFGAEAFALNGIGVVQMANGDYPHALEQYWASLGLSRTVGNRRGEANALANIAAVHFLRAEYAQALELLQASLEISRQTGARASEANTLNTIGGVHSSLGEYLHALAQYRTSLGICQEIGDRSGEGRTMIGIGNVHSALGEHRQALEHFESSLGISREVGNRGDEALVLHNIGNQYASLLEYPRALEHYRACLEISREIGDQRSEVAGLIGIASVHTVQGAFPLALAELEAAAATARQSGDRRGLGEAMSGLGETYAALEQSEDSVASLVEAIALAVEQGARPMELAARELIWGQYRIIGNLSDALENLQRYSELKEEVLGEETRRTIQNRETMLQIQISRKEAEIERLRNVELKQAFDELKAAQSSLVQSERMASLGQLTAGIAHEINNPINFVSASVPSLRRDHLQIQQALGAAIDRMSRQEAEEFSRDYDIEETFEELEQLLGSIESGAARTAEIVSGLRSFSRVDEGGLKRVDLHEGLDAALVILSGAMSEGITLARDYGDLPGVECYPGEINQVFMNILTNAIRAIDGAGTVTIRSEAIGDTVAITISDTGVGMPPEVQSRIFEPFFTTRDVGEGRGLGLSIAWGIVEKHGGTIEVDSTPGSGSTFAIILPTSFLGK